ncbi:MAG: ATP-binding cassette domain-containing protein [Opitutales bacterium]|nr:ATP-binding cassette domain-containing protein [Opitutales bacterium]
MLIELNKVVPTPLPGKIIKSSEIWDHNLRIESQSKILISAQSGMGKSTLLHLIYGLRHDYTGQFSIAGKPAKKLTFKQWEKWRRDSISLVFQDLRLFPHLSAQENIELIPEINPSAPSVEEMVDRLGMGPYLQQLVSSLSHGQRQRIAIIRALHKPFRILLLDEPFSHLDKSNQILACELIKEVVEQQQAGLILSSLGSASSLPFDYQYKL